MNCILLGDRSEIGSYLGERLKLDGWDVFGWNRTTHTWLLYQVNPVDLIISAIGRLGPIGPWSEYAGRYSMDDNLHKPLSVVQGFWKQRAKHIKICFLAGSNPNRITPSYSAYDVGKMALMRAVENMDAEEPEATVWALGPGFVPTKFHAATKEAGIKDVRLENPQPVETYLPRVYDCLKWCLSQPKEVIGGRNIHVGDPWGNELAARLAINPNLYKLRRAE